MSTSSWSFDVVEETASDAMDGVPLAKNVWKIGSRWFSISKLQGLVNEGRDKLHEAAELLGNQEVKSILERLGQYDALFDAHSCLDVIGESLEEQLNGTKTLQLGRKYRIHVTAIRWKNSSIKHHQTIRKKSDRAKLGLNPDDGTRIRVSISRPGNGAASEEPRDWETQSNQTTVVPGVSGDDTTSAFLDGCDHPVESE